MTLAQAPSPHKPRVYDLGALMRQVIYAAVPGVLMLFVSYGWGVWLQLWICCFTALVCEALCLALRQRPILPTLKDCTALVTAVLLGLALPPYAPWWCGTLGTGFAIVVGKQLYGGMGFNPFNPAMLGYVFLLVSFPVQMTMWATPVDMVKTPMGLLDAFSLVWLGLTGGQETLVSLASGIDAWSGASPLDTLKTQLSQGFTRTEVMEAPLYRGLSGLGRGWVNIAFLLGGVYLCLRKIADWRIPAGILGALTAWASLFYLADSDYYASPGFHLLNGATMMGAFFIATDPVTASTTPWGRWLFGLGIGSLIFLIRTFGGYPDAVSFSVLLMNLTAPTLDYLTVPRVFGHRKSE